MTEGVLHSVVSGLTAVWQTDGNFVLILPKVQGRCQLDKRDVVRGGVYHVLDVTFVYEEFLGFHVVEPGAPLRPSDTNVYLAWQVLTQSENFKQTVGCSQDVPRVDYAS